MNKVTDELLRLVAGFKGEFTGAYNIREDGGCAGRQSTKNIKIESKTDKPGIDIRVARNGHTFAMNMVLFRTKNGQYLFTGDAAYVKGNVIGAKKDGVSTPNGYAVGSLYQVICTLQDILKIVGGNADRILAGHEPGVWSQFPSEITEDNLHIAYVAK